VGSANLVQHDDWQPTHRGARHRLVHRVEQPLRERLAALDLGGKQDVVDIRSLAARDRDPATAKQLGDLALVALPAFLRHRVGC